LSAGSSNNGHLSNGGGGGVHSSGGMHMEMNGSLISGMGGASTSGMAGLPMGSNGGGSNATSNLFEIKKRSIDFFQHVSIRSFLRDGLSAPFSNSTARSLAPFTVESNHAS